MLEMALDAELPLISVYTDDTVNVGQILEATAGQQFVRVAEDNVHKLFSGVQRSVKRAYVIAPEMLNYNEVYESCVEHGVTLVLVNPKDNSNIPFNAGWIKVAARHIRSMLEEIVLEEDLPDLLNAFAGLSLKDIGEVIKISMTEYGELTVDRVLSIRRLLNRNTKGLSEVETFNPAYVADDQLKKWLKVDGKLLMAEDTPYELIPRGLVFDGSPGTGKTEGAKYLAHELGVPLYRLDLGALMNKYVGESEQNLDRLLAIVDKSDPCILLLDEVEKIFKTTDDSGVTSRLLSQLLWWLQEHTSRVFTVMTTNMMASLPQELIRPGRIDECWTFSGLDHDEAYEFANTYYEASLQGKIGVALEDVDYTSIIEPIWTDFEGHQYKLTPAQIVAAIHKYLKKILTNT